MFKYSITFCITLILLQCIALAEIPDSLKKVTTWRFSYTGSFDYFDMSEINKKLELRDFPSVDNFGLSYGFSVMYNCKYKNPEKIANFDFNDWFGDHSFFGLGIYFSVWNLFRQNYPTEFDTSKVDDYSDYKHSLLSVWGITLDETICLPVYKSISCNIDYGINLAYYTLATSVRVNNLSYYNDFNVTEHSSIAPLPYIGTSLSFGLKEQENCNRTGSMKLYITIGGRINFVLNNFYLEDKAGGTTDLKLGMNDVFQLFKSYNIFIRVSIDFY